MRQGRDTGLLSLGEPVERGWTYAQGIALGVWVTLARCYATYAKALISNVQEYGLTAPQFGTLEVLCHLGPLSLGELADKLLITGGNVTYVMDRLEDLGPGCRHRQADDRRVIQARLTADGRERSPRCFLTTRPIFKGCRDSKAVEAPVD